MSYIRCLSNPESLYIYGSAEAVCWSWKDEEGKLCQASCSYRYFNEIMRRFDRADHDLPIQYGKMKLEEIQPRHTDEAMDLMFKVYCDKKKHLAPRLKRLEREDRHAFKYKLTFPDGQELIMWRVTWVYVFNNWKGR